MNRETKPYILKRSSRDEASRRLSLDYAAALNGQQLAAVQAPDGPALVIAGAGSGKTRTLIYRVAYLIDSGIDPARILLLTFTRKAAQEMVAPAAAGFAGRIIHRARKKEGSGKHRTKAQPLGSEFEQVAFQLE